MNSPPPVVADILRRALPAHQSEYRANSLVRLSRSEDGVERICAADVDTNYALLEALLGKCGAKPLATSIIAQGVKVLDVHLSHSF